MDRIVNETDRQYLSRLAEFPTEDLDRRQLLALGGKIKAISALVRASVLSSQAMAPTFQVDWRDIVHPMGQSCIESSSHEPKRRWSCFSSSQSYHTLEQHEKQQLF